MKKILQEFKQFAMRGNVIDMAAVSYTHLESLGLLVLLGFDIAALTPVAYLRRSLQPVSYTHLTNTLYYEQLLCIYYLDQTSLLLKYTTRSKIHYQIFLRIS